MDKPASEVGHFHAVKFYDSQDSLCRLVAGFLAEGLIEQQPALLIATPEHRNGIVDELRARHFDIDRLVSTGDFVQLDAATVLASIMVDGMPDEQLFLHNMLTTVERICRGRHCVLRAYGEMVDVLWKQQQDVAAIRLEMLWNKLAASKKFSLLCGYAMGNFYKDAQLRDIHRQHSHVVTGDRVHSELHDSPIH
jgi:hypothetical protein